MTKLPKIRLRLSKSRSKTKHTLEQMKVCYDAIIDISGFTYTCTDCDSLVYDVNLHTWRLLNMSNPTTIQELSYKAINNNKIYSLLGEELTEIPIGVMYIQNRKKYIKIK